MGTKLKWSGSRQAQREYAAACSAHPPRPKPGKGKKRKGRKKPARAPYRGSYADYLQSPWWQKRRKRALRRAGYRCEQCRDNRLLQVHHLTYATLGMERDKDLEVLCERCHQYRHQGVMGMDSHLRAIAGQ